MDQPKKSTRGNDANNSVPHQEGIRTSHRESDKAKELAANADHKQRRPYWSRLKQAWNQTTISNKLIVLFTFIIALSNFFYTRYAKRQWVVMERQLTDVEAAQAAQIVVDDFKPDIYAGKPGQGEFITGNFTIRNAGQTIASEIYVAQSSWGSIRPPTPMYKLKPIPVPNGPSLAQGQTRDYPVGVQEGNWDGVQQGKWFIGFDIAVNYKDVFGNSKIVSDCFMYYRRTQMFGPCPVAVPQGGFPPAEK
jgi:hypothetical protein